MLLDPDHYDLVICSVASKSKAESVFFGRSGARNILLWGVDLLTQWKFLQPEEWSHLEELVLQT